MESVGTCLLDDPAVGGVVASSREVTGRKEDEDAVRRSEAELFSALERITEAFFALGREWCFAYVNPQAGFLFNREGVTARFEEFYPPPGGSGPWRHP